MQGETEKLVTEMTEAEKEAEKQIEPEDKIPAKFHIRKVDLEKHGFTANCPGCRAALRGTTKQKHTETCRARLFEATADDDRVVRSTKRIEEYVARKAEEQDVKKRRLRELGEAVRRAFRGTNAMMRRTAACTSTAKESENERGHHDRLREEGTFEETATAHLGGRGEED